MRVVLLAIICLGVLAGAVIQVGQVVYGWFLDRRYRFRRG